MRSVFFHLICIQTDSGLPFFSRTVGPVEQLPDQVISSLNVAHTYCASYLIELKQTLSGEVCVNWKTFSYGITLILISNISDDEWIYERLFNLIHKSVIFMVGRDKLSTAADVDNGHFDGVKKYLQKTYCLLDSLLLTGMPINTNNINNNNTNNINRNARKRPQQCLDLNLITLSNGCLCSEDVPRLQLHFDDFTSHIVKTKLACMFIKGFIAASTDKFNRLTASESTILQHYVIKHISQSVVNVTVDETVVYLPDSSPNMSLRLVTIKLLQDVIICLLLADRPMIKEVLAKTQEHWTQQVDLLSTMTKMRNVSLPYLPDINKDVVRDEGPAMSKHDQSPFSTCSTGFLIINQLKHRHIVCTDVNNDDDGEEEEEDGKGFERGRVLTAFYEHCVSNFMDREVIENKAQNLAIPCTTSNPILNINHHMATDSYLCLDNHKCYACMIRKGDDIDYEVYAVYKKDIPTYALKSTTNLLFESFLQTKWFNV